MLSTRARTLASAAVLGAAVVAGLLSFGIGKGALNAIGIHLGRSADPKWVAELATATTIDWSDLVPPQEAASTPRLADGSLPRGIVFHGELGPITGNGATYGEPPPPPELARKLGGYNSLEAPPRRVADTFGIGNFKALQPSGGDVRADLDGKEIRMAGFIAPLAFDGTRISEFLLVPYVGACIHVPPPPANQIVYVGDNLGDYSPDGGLLFPVWVTGRLRAVPMDSELAEVGYQIERAKVERYEQ